MAFLVYLCGYFALCYYSLGALYFYSKQSSVVPHVQNYQIKKNINTELRKQRISVQLLKDVKRFDNPNDYYSVLKVKKTSTPDAIKRAYEHAKQIYNPELLTYIFGEPIVTDNIDEEIIYIIKDVRINIRLFMEYLDNAYDTLVYPAKKGIYDANILYSKEILDSKRIDEILDTFISHCTVDFDKNDPASYWTKHELKEIKQNIQ